jgi:hypothetical protein
VARKLRSKANEMTRSYLVTLAGLGIAAAAAVAATAGAADGAPGAARCADAARMELSVPVAFDEVRVMVGAGRPGAASAVTVVAGDSDRRVTAFGRGRWALAMTDMLPAGPVVVAVEPVLDAPASACVERVELVRGGAVIASAHPR